jgi:hypothetical protein
MGLTGLMEHRDLWVLRDLKEFKANLDWMELTVLPDLPGSLDHRDLWVLRDLKEFKANLDWMELTEHRDLWVR